MSGSERKDGESRLDPRAPAKVGSFHAFRGRDGPCGNHRDIVTSENQKNHLAGIASQVSKWHKLVLSGRRTEEGHRWDRAGS